nr:zinc finger, CCHC-type [Tanacetum cinerariifolium]
GAQRGRKVEVFQVSNDDTAVAQRRLEDKQHKKKTNTDCFVKEQEKEYQTGWKIKTVAQRRLEDKQHKEKTNTDCFVKEQEKEYQTGWKIKTGNILDSCNQRCAQQCMKSGVAKHLGIAGIQQQNGLVDETNMTLFAKEQEGIFCLGYKIRENKFLGVQVHERQGKGNVLGLEIIRDQSGNTLRVSQSRIHNEKLVQTLLKGHSTLSLEDSLSGDCDVEKNDFDYAMERSITVMSRSITGYGLILGCAGSLKARLQHMEGLSITEAGYMTFTEA